MLGSLGFAEIAFIMVLALLIFGPKRLPEAGKMVGRAMGEFRRASNELRRTFNAELSVEEEERKAGPRRLADTVPETAEAAVPAAPGEDREQPAPGPPGAVARDEAPGSIPEELSSSGTEEKGEAAKPADPRISDEA